eukprot:2341973-Rhodomonas_salina.1
MHRPTAHRHTVQREITYTPGQYLTVPLGLSFQPALQLLPPHTLGQYRGRRSRRIAATPWQYRARHSKRVGCYAIGSFATPNQASQRTGVCSEAARRFATPRTQLAK